MAALNGDKSGMQTDLNLKCSLDPSMLQVWTNKFYPKDLDWVHQTVHYFRYFVKHQITSLICLCNVFECPLLAVIFF